MKIKLIIIIKRIIESMTKKKRPRNSLLACRQYVKYLEDEQYSKSEHYVDFEQYEVVKNPTESKLISFYLPQYYQLEENDKWHERGFTEWTNVTKAQPLYAGHYQPHLPIDMGFYNLENEKTFERQIDLAKNYGIYGFSFYYYWFSGKKLMSKPIDTFLKNKNLNFPFCLCWACENWSKLWDGGNKEILVHSELKNDDYLQFYEDFAPFALDDRYIKIDGKPVLLIYRPTQFKKDVLFDFLGNLRRLFKEKNNTELHVLWVLTSNTYQRGFDIEPRSRGFDACVEFSPQEMVHCINPERKILEKQHKGYLNPNFNGKIYNVEEYIRSKKYLNTPEYKTFKTVFPNWDNTPRKACSGGHIFEGMTPELYKQWLIDTIKWTKEKYSKNERIVFLNAWNEWGEGAHLEPDRKNGYAYLQATKDALENE